MHSRLAKTVEMGTDSRLRVTRRTLCVEFLWS